MSLVLRRVHGQRLQDRLLVADAHPLAEQALQDLLDLAGPEQARHDLVDQRRRGGPGPVEEAADLVAGHQLVGMPQDDLAEVAGDDRRRLQDPAARQLGDLAAVGVDPDGGLARSPGRRRRGRRAARPGPAGGTARSRPA